MVPLETIYTDVLQGTPAAREMETDLWPETDPRYHNTTVFIVQSVVSLLLFQYVQSQMVSTDSIKGQMFICYCHLRALASYICMGS